MRTDESSSRRNSGRQRLGLFVLGLIVVVLGWTQLVVLTEQTSIGLFTILTAAALAAVLPSTPGGRLRRVGMVLVGATVLAQIAWLTTQWYPLHVVALTFAVVIGFLAFATVFATRPARGKAVGGARVRRIALVAAGSAASLLAVVVSAVVIVTAITPAPLVDALRASAGQANSFDPAAPTKSTEVNGVGLTNDIRYGTEYPNSYLDVYIAHNDPSVSRPTYVVVHGGGWIGGDKADGDPNAADGGGAYFALGTLPMMKAGYNVVSVNYALAPQYRYPTPAKQLGQAMQFLQANGARYGLDMSRVVLSGGSAGGQIVGQYAEIQTNPDYARSLGIKPTMDRSSLKAMVFDSAAFDLSRLGKPLAPNAFKGWTYDLSGRSYLPNRSDKTMLEANVTEHTTSDFPPSFVSDGNNATFPDQAAEFAARLQNMGVPAQLNLYTRQEAILGHGFTAQASKSTDDYNRLKLDFLARFVPGAGK